ncbi:MAG: hypothetical protein B6229_00450 [Spirochaetaceae bacterium 4572_7]|nr:MAG: hypothetical protein B6229_00450 [Spirochaetaceae bacterium 4572_7]
MAKKKRFGNPLKEKAYKEALKKAKKSKLVDGTPKLFIGNKNNYQDLGISVNGISAVCTVNEKVVDGIDTNLKFHRTMRDHIGKYEFIMEACDSNNVFVTVEGTPYKHSKMSKKQAHWEWDMIWNKFGVPTILAA